MDDDRAPHNARHAGPATEACRFDLSVWPATPAAGWHAELRSTGAAPMRFERAFDLIVFLTDLGDAASRPSTGLR